MEHKRVAWRAYIACCGRLPALGVIVLVPLPAPDPAHLLLAEREKQYSNLIDLNAAAAAAEDSTPKKK